ncbi:MAG: cytochrome c-type biogenesis protein CcmH [Vicinamibacterales bacterium]
MRWMVSLAAVAALLGMAYLATGGRAFPSVDSPAAEAWDVAGDLMSPFCPGRTLAACPSGAAADVRDEIAKRLEKGESRESIEADLLARYGDEIRGAPEASGIGLLVWVGPVALGVLLLGIVLQLARRSRREADAGQATAGPVDPKLAERLDEELEQLG